MGRKLVWLVTNLKSLNGCSIKRKNKVVEPRLELDYGVVKLTTVKISKASAFGRMKIHTHSVIWVIIGVNDNSNS